MSERFYIERWAQKSVDVRDREFYLLALPIAVTVVGVTPHLLQLIFLPGGEGNILRLSAQVVVGALLTGVVCYGITRWLSRPGAWGPVRHRWSVISHILLLFTPITLLVDAPQRMAELSMIMDPTLWSPAITSYVLGASIGRTLLFAGGVVFYERLMGAVLEAANQRHRALFLETETLKNLIQPHFLLNSLNAIRAYIEEAPKTAEEMTLNLTALLRRVIDWSAKEAIPLKEEIEIVYDYVNIMNQRYEADFKITVKGGDLRVTLPPLTIFSLVENSFKHGFAGRVDGSIMIVAEPGNRLKISVIDDGGRKSEEDDSGGVGAQYIQARLELYFGDDFSFYHGEREEGGYEAVLEIPWRTEILE